MFLFPLIPHPETQLMHKYLSFVLTNFWQAREEYRSLKYKRQVKWAVDVIARNYHQWKIRQYLLTIPLRLPPNTLSPLSLEWPAAPGFLADASRLLRAIYHRWKCYIYRNSFDQTARNRMREKVTASIIFKDRKASYARRSVLAHLNMSKLC